MGEGSSFLNLLLEFVENFHDHSDVVDEIRQYLYLLKKEDVRVVYNRLDEDDRQVKNKNAPFVASVKVLRY